MLRALFVLSVPALILWQTLGAASLVRERGARLVVEVRIQDFASVPSGVLQPAMEMAREVFSRAKIESTWTDCTPGTSNLDPLCRSERRAETKVLRILSQEMTARLDTSGAEFGRAHLVAGRSRGTYASVYWPRVQYLLDGPARAGSLGMPVGPAWLRAARILGYVLAHELAHLYGIHHGKRGVMSGPWSPAELVDVMRGTLRFQRRDRALLQARLRH